jgi:alanine racemase
MMMPVYTLDEISLIVGGTLSGKGATSIAHLVYDSRRMQHPESSLFFAIRTAHADGHQFIEEVYRKGVRAFVVSQPITLDDASIILVNDTVLALQALSAFHRQQFTNPVIGITGSNGKTIVKEWLNSLLEPDYSIARSPKSYNSQIGVPLSVWELEPQHTLGIFEAGISRPGEMERLEKVIRPTLGLLTNIGEAHSEGFSSQEEKLKEKLKLFANSEIVIGEAALLTTHPGNKFTWSHTGPATLKINNVRKGREAVLIEAVYRESGVVLSIPFTDEASIQNAINCWCVLLYLGIEQAEIQKRFYGLHPIDMRMQLNHGINHCLVINDSYSADTTSLKIALDFLAQQSAGLKRTVILSDFYESGKKEEVLYEEIGKLISHYHVDKLIAIGEKIGIALAGKLPSSVQVQSYPATEDFIQHFHSSSFNSEIILLKGARKAGFERIAALFEQKLHGTVLQINLAALTHNLKEYQKLLKPETKVMAMVKAFSYGSGGAEIASVLQFNNVAYLGVAYADEGVELVKAGITIPIMVMNAEASSFATIVEHDLQPVIYSPALLDSFEGYIKQQGLTGYPVHMEVETGMNRLGFAPEELSVAADHFASNKYLAIQSLFSHLAASEDASQDAYTSEQAQRFSKAVAILQQKVGTPFLKHLSNSAAIVRHPQLQMDMVRLGIGLYGVEPDAEDLLDLQPVATLRSTVAQIKEVKAGESISYNRRGMVTRDSRIATVRIGYADGYSRRLGNGVGKMMVQGQLAPVIGTVCMDMTMLDITDIASVREGDDVIVFGWGLPVQDVAGWIQTIPYEIMTSVSQRVKRVYYYE